MPRPRTRPIANSVTVDSLSELMNAIEIAQYELRSAELWYRGHCSSRWKLHPSLYRGMHESMYKNIRRWSRERTMFVKFQCAAYSRGKDLPNQDNISQWLCLMRHFGLSTRLLDWTRSPLVACYFALREKPIKTPTIWILDPDKLNNHYETIAPVLTLRDRTPDERLARHLSNVLVEGEEEKSILAVHPPEVDNRILSQRSVFTIHGRPEPLQKINIKKSYLYRINLSKTAARNISKSLKIFGYDDTVMFPDLGHLADKLANQYKYNL